MYASEILLLHKKWSGVEKMCELIYMILRKSVIFVGEIVKTSFYHWKYMILLHWWMKEWSYCCISLENINICHKKQSVGFTCTVENIITQRRKLGKFMILYVELEKDLPLMLFMPALWYRTEMCGISLGSWETRDNQLGKWWGNYVEGIHRMGPYKKIKK